MIDLHKVRVGIAGAGGIGSNVAMNLVRTGICNLKIVDYDRVDMSNLNRQFYFKDQIGNYKVDMLYDNLLRIDEKAIIDKIILKLTSDNIIETFSDCDVVVEALDKKEGKKMLVEALSGTSKVLVSASGIAGSNVDNISRKKIGNCHIIGDFQSDSDSNKLYSHKVMLVACIMSNLVIEEIN